MATVGFCETLRAQSRAQLEALSAVPPERTDSAAADSAASWHTTKSFYVYEQGAIVGRCDSLELARHTMAERLRVRAGYSFLRTHDVHHTHGIRTVYATLFGDQCAPVGDMKVSNERPSVGTWLRSAFHAVTSA